MLKRLFKFIQKMIVSAFILYSYNVIASPLNLIVPINLFTILILTILGLPALFGLIIILLFAY